jgi:hypothetical protein
MLSHDRKYGTDRLITRDTYILTRIILRPLSALSLDEDLNSPCDKNASAAL